MPITDFDEYVDLLTLNRAAIFIASAFNLNAVNRPIALWRHFLPLPATPTTSVALDKASDVSIGPIPASSTGNLAVFGARLGTGEAVSVSLTVIDLLNHSGGLSGIVTTEQTTNLPSAALTRYTDGRGVLIGVVIYTDLGTTGTTITVRYTNQDGTANQVSPAIAIGGANATGMRSNGRLLLVPMAAGDTGARSVEGVTLAGSTGTAGNFGVVLFKPLTALALEDITSAGSASLDAITGSMAGPLAPFPDTACLSLMVISPVNQTINGALLLGEV